MARADGASASLRPDSIKGLAQSIAKPAYRRFIIAEPALRRAVPALILAFLVTVGIGACVQVLEHRHQTMAAALADIETIADSITDRLKLLIDNDEADPITVGRPLLDRAANARAITQGRRVLLTDPFGTVVAQAPEDSSTVGRKVADVIGRGQTLTAFGISSGVLEITLPSGEQALATARAVKTPFGQAIIVQGKSDALASWRSAATLTVTLFATTMFVLLMLGFSFHWQSKRARETDLINDTLRSRIDTALTRGRCGLWDWDLARGRIFWSQSMFDILGLESKDQLLTFGEVSTLVHPDDIKLYELAAQLADASTTSVDHAFRMRHARGEWVWLRARCELVVQPGEPGAHVIGIAVDVTEQKKLAEKSAAADLRLRDAIETISEAFVIWDADNRLVLCNSKFQSLHGLPDPAVKPGAAYDDIVDAGRKPIVRMQLPMEGTLEQGARVFEAQLDDGRWLHISERRTKDGGFVSVGTDITVLKRHEQNLTDSERRLKATVSDLRRSQHALESQTRQLAELAEKYAEERTRAQEANHAKSEFLANMSHELRTPLNAIIGFSEIMESSVFGPLGDEKYHEYCRDIRESGRYLLDVINDILDMSKIEAGRTKLEIEEVELGRVLSETLRIIAPRIEDKRLVLSTEIADGVRLRADRRAVKQIALNLLSNAVKFTPAGGRVALQARRIGGAVTITVADTGIGIPKAALRNLGRPFEQVESQLTKSHKGSGLGLAIARSLSELHGGTMRIRSSPGIGTVVLVRLPPPLPVEDAAAVPLAPKFGAGREQAMSHPKLSAVHEEASGMIH